MVGNEEEREEEMEVNRLREDVVKTLISINVEFDLRKGNSEC